jgi:hypothetical protein
MRMCSAFTWCRVSREEGKLDWEGVCEESKNSVQEQGAQQQQHQEKGQDKVKEIIIYSVSRQQMNKYIHGRQKGTLSPFL